MSAVARYLYEFTPLAYVLIYIILAYIWRKLRADPFERKVFILVISLLFIANAIMGCYLGLNGMVQ